MRKKCLLGLLAATIYAPFILGLGLGEITIHSKLNQPLDAEIEIISASPEELSNLKLSIPSDEAFARYDLERVAVLGNIRFKVETRTGAKKTISLKSTDVVKDPFLTFLIQADWPQGRMLREYTVLVDPPLYVPSQSTRSQTQPYIAPATSNNRPSNTARGVINRTSRPAPAPIQASTPVQAVTATPTQEPAPSIRPMRTSTTNASTTYNEGVYRVRRGDTLWDIAHTVRPDDSLSINQTMMAIYHSNSNAFVGNINRLRADRTLNLPDRAQVSLIKHQAATAEVRSQTNSWREAKRNGSLASRSMDSPQSTTTPTKLDGKSEVGTLLSSSEGTLVLKVPDLDSELDSRAGGTSDTAGLGDDASENSSSELETKVEEFERLLSVKDNELASLQDELTETSTTIEEPASEEPKAEEPKAEEPKAEEPKAEEPKAEEPKAEEPKDSGDLMELLKLAGMGLAVAIFIGFLVIFIFRNMNKGPSHDTLFVDEDLDLTAKTIAENVKSKVGQQYEGGGIESAIEEPMAPFAADIDFEITESGAETVFEDQATDDTLKMEAPAFSDEAQALPFEDTTLADISLGTMQLDQSDPIAETDFHMAYGLYDQAAELMQSALEQNDNFAYKEKLLEVYFVSGNKPEFLRYVNEIKDEAMTKHSSAWDNIVIMGKQLAPDEAIFSGEASAAALDDGLDFSLGETSLTQVDQSLFGDPLEETSLDLEEISESPLDAWDNSEGVQDFDVLESTMDIDPTFAADFAGAQDAETTEELNVESLLDMDIGATVLSESLDFGIDDLDDELSLDAPDTNLNLASDTDFEGAADQSDETLNFSFDLDDSDDIDLEATGSLALDIVDSLGVEEENSSTTVLRSDENLDFMLDEQNNTGNEALDLDLDSMLAENGNDSSAAETMGDLLALAVEDAVTMQIESDASISDSELSFDNVLGEDDPHSSTARITDDELAAMGLSDNGPEDILGMTGMSFNTADEVDEVSTKIDLARAYIEMDDPDNAKSILQEVIDDGNDAQRGEAESILSGLS